MPGTWEAKQYWCGMSLNDPTIDATQKYANEQAGGPWGCNGLSNFALDNGTNVDGLALKRTDTVSISAVAGSQTLVDVAFPTHSMFYPDGGGSTYASLNEPKLIDALLLEIWLYSDVLWIARLLKKMAEDFQLISMRKE